MISQLIISSNDTSNTGRRKETMEYDLCTTDWILEKVRSDDVYAQHLYAAMCNNEFQKLEMWPILKDERWSCSWRHAGGIIAEMCNEGDYLNWYCSGIVGDEVSEDEFRIMTDANQERYLRTKSHVPEGCVTIEITDDLKKLGWKVIDPAVSQ